MSLQHVSVEMSWRLISIHWFVYCATGAGQEGVYLIAGGMRGGISIHMVFTKHITRTRFLTSFHACQSTKPPPRTQHTPARMLHPAHAEGRCSADAGSRPHAWQQVRRGVGAVTQQRRKRDGLIGAGATKDWGITNSRHDSGKPERLLGRKAARAQYAMLIRRCGNHETSPCHGLRVLWLRAQRTTPRRRIGRARIRRALAGGCRRFEGHAGAYPGSGCVRRGAWPDSGCGGGLRQSVGVA